ncbi:13807_t:CDS:2, partial [Gigaspora margarita]
LCIGVHDELPSVNVTYKAANSQPIPGNYNCNNYINKTIYDPSQSKYIAAFSANYYVKSYTGCILSINITDPRYNISNQSDYMVMYAYDKEYDLNPRIGQFEQSLSLKNMYFFGQPRNDIAILSMLGIIGGIWSFAVALYIFLFGPGLISPWGFVQKSKLFKDQYEKDVLPFVFESDTSEDLNSSMQRRLNNLEKRIEFYDKFVIDNSLLTLAHKDEQSTIYNSEK